MGTSIGDTISRWTKLSPGEKRTLIAVGGVPVLRRHLWAAGRSNIRSRRNKARLSFHRAWRGFCGSSYCGYCGAFSFRRRPCVCNSKLSTPSSLLIAHIRHLGYSGRFTGVAFNRVLLGTMDLFAGLQSRFGLGIVVTVGQSLASPVGFLQ